MRAPFDLDAIDHLSRDELAAILARVAAHLAELGAAARLAQPEPASSAAVDPTTTLSTAPEVAASLKVPVARVYEMARTHTIPSVRIGRAVRFDLAAVRRSLG